MIYPVILSGGIGKRLWPVSNQSNPKQFQKLFNDKTLLQNTYDRILKGFDKNNIFVVTGDSMITDIKAQIDIEDSQIFGEPVGKGTAMAIGYAALKLKQIDEEAILVMANSDHAIEPEKKYLEALNKAKKIVENNPNKILLLGIKPRYPETGYGHIELGDSMGDGVYNVKSLKEKPDLETAKLYTESGRYLWSPAMFIFKAKQLLEWYKEHLPNTYKALINIEQGKDVEEQYNKVENISIDYGLLEKLSDMLVLPVDFDWADIGHWRSLRDVLSDGDGANVSNTKNVSIDSKNNLLYSSNDKKLIATVGVEDMILVETDEAILLCPADRAQDIKLLLEKIKKEKLDKYL